MFVPQDLNYLQTTADSLLESNPSLLPLIAHDRAGFGGALFSQAIAILLTALWGIQQGDRWNGSSVLQLNPLGDLLAVLAAAVWAVYSVLIKKISNFGYNTIQTTRRTFFYGLLLMIPALFIFDTNTEWTRFAQVDNILNLLFLGLGASALCFVTWGYAVKVIGAIKTSVYIYLVPVITIVTAVIILHERITWMALLGTALTIAGLFLSESKQKAQTEG